MRVVVRLAGPDSMLVELDALVGRPAKNHGPHPAVANWKRVRPDLRRLLVPELLSRRGGHEKEKNQGREYTRVHTNPNAVVSLIGVHPCAFAANTALTLNGHRRQIPAGDHAVDHAVTHGLIRLHNVVP